MTEEMELTGNQKAFEAWLNISNVDRPQFAVFIDGDLVETGNNFPYLVTNASELRALRGEDAQLAIYDARTKESVPV